MKYNRFVYLLFFNIIALTVSSTAIADTQGNTIAPPEETESSGPAAVLTSTTETSTALPQEAFAPGNQASPPDSPPVKSSPSSATDVEPPQNSDDEFNPFDPTWHFNLELQLGGIVSTNASGGPAYPFFGRLGVGVLLSQIDVFYTFNAIGTVGISWSGGLQFSVNSQSTGLWAYGAVEYGDNNAFSGSIGIGWTIAGIEYQQDFSDGFRSPYAINLFLRFPFGLFF